MTTREMTEIKEQVKNLREVRYRIKDTLKRGLFLNEEIYPDSGTIAVFNFIDESQERYATLMLKDIEEKLKNLQNRLNNDN